MKLLVFATDATPLKGLPTSGTALRTHGLINGLRAHGHQVIVSVPQSALSGLKRSIDESSLEPETLKELRNLEALAFDSANASAVLAEVNPDAVLCGHWPAMVLRVKPSQALILDLAGPHLLERHYQGMPDPSGAARAKLSAIATADYYIVSGPSQRLYFLSFMLRAGVSKPESRICTITMPLDPNIPQTRSTLAGGDSYPRFVFAGVFLPWQDPSAALESVSSELESKKRGTLTLIGGTHPNYNIKEGLYGKLFSKLSKNPLVTKKPMLPYSNFLSELRSCDVAVDLMAWNLERHLAMTIRSTSYLWSGVPVIYNDYANLGELIREYNAGWCVSPKDEQGLREVLNSIYDNPEVVLNKSRNASRLAREVFSWDRAVEPLLPFLTSPETMAGQETDIIYDFPDNAECPVTEKKSIQQYFLCRMNGLSRVECRVATHNSTVDYPVRISLYQYEQGRDAEFIRRHNIPPRLVTERVVSGDAIQNNEWLGLDIKPLEGSGGKTFSLHIETKRPEKTNSISPWIVKGRPFPLLSLYYGNTAMKHLSLCLRTSCSGAGAQCQL